MDKHVLAIPAGVTVSGEAELLGLRGSLILNINEGLLLGVFHFSTVSLAGGNLFLFEESMETSNNVVLKVGGEPRPEDDKRTRAD